MRPYRLTVTFLVGLVAACSTFGATQDPPVDAGAPLEASAADALVPPKSDAGSEDGAATPFCALPENTPFAASDGGPSRFCDDFDRKPDSVDFLGWTPIVDDGGVLAFDRRGRSAPFALTATIGRGRSFHRALQQWSEPPKQDFRMRFHVMADAPPPANAPLYVAHVLLANDFMLSLRATGVGPRLVVSETRLDPNGNVPGKGVPITRAPALDPGVWIPVEIRVTGTSWEVLMGGESTGPQEAFVRHPSPFLLKLQLGIQAYDAPAGAIAADTTFHFDDVVVDARP